MPTIKNRNDGSTLHLTDYARACVPTGQVHIHARELTRGVKVLQHGIKVSICWGNRGIFWLYVVRTDTTFMW